MWTKMKFSQAIVVTALAWSRYVCAFWRMECQSSGLGRIDPIIDPGNISAHTHTFHGSGGLGPDVKYEDITAKGTCTSCAVTQDRSVYWTPAVYFMYTNGTAVLVEQVGGMLAYYNFGAYGDRAAVPFPEGFRMVAGDPNVRNFTGPFPDTPQSSWPLEPTDQFFLQQRAIGFNCLHYAVPPNEPSVYRHQFPTKEFMDEYCLDGLRLELGFPRCGNGSLDSTDHRSHVKYPTLIKSGNCPASHNVSYYPYMFFETIWNTYAFKGEPGQYMLSTGDPVGTGYHGDFMMGWESEDFLNQSLKVCTNASGMIDDCPTFDVDRPAASHCSFALPENLKDDDYHGPRDGLPVDVPIQHGPQYATKYVVAQTPSAQQTAGPTPGSSSGAPAPTHSPSKSESTKPSQSAETESALVPTSSEITTAPSSDSTNSTLDIVATSYITSGQEVLELVIEEATVTVTATPDSSPSGVHKRDLHHLRHLQQQHHHHRHI